MPKENKDLNESLEAAGVPADQSAAVASIVEEKIKADVEVGVALGVEQATVALKEEHEAKLDEVAAAAEVSKAEYETTLSENANRYLTSVVEGWERKNEQSLVNAEVVDVSKSIIESVKALVREHGIEVDASHAEKIADLEESLAAAKDEIAESEVAHAQAIADKDARITELTEEVNTIEKAIVLAEATEGLTDTAIERVSSMAEAFTGDVGEYKDKVQSLVESISKGDAEEQLQESATDVAKGTAPIGNGYASHL